MEGLFRIKDFPIHMGVTEQEEKDDLFHDLIYEINAANGEVQIAELISEEDLYQEAHYNNVGDGWRNYYQAFAGFVAEYEPKNIY